MAREKIYKIRLDEVERERLERVAQKHEIPLSQVFREWLKAQDKEAESVA
ncbi:hypothetical protein [Chroococcidiopsis sp.]